MRLREFQGAFGALMLGETPDDPGAELAACFGDTGAIPLKARLGVYRNNIAGGLTETLIVGFPVLEKLVGRDFLEHMAQRFVLAHPPAQGCLNTYGEELAPFIEGFAPASHLPWLADMARLEIAMNKAYYAPDDAALQADALAGLPQERLHEVRLSLTPSATLLRSPHALTAIRNYCLAGAPDGQAPDPDSGGVRLLIYRPVLETVILEMDEGAFVMTERLAAGDTLGETLARVLEAEPDFDAGAFLSGHFRAGIFSARSPLL